MSWYLLLDIVGWTGVGGLLVYLAIKRPALSGAARDHYSVPYASYTREEGQNNGWVDFGENGKDGDESTFRPGSPLHNSNPADWYAYGSDDFDGVK